MNINIELLDIFCDFIKSDTEDGSYICKNCGNKMLYSSVDGEVPMIPCAVKLSKPIQAPKEFIPPQLKWYEKLYNFVYAVIKHIRTGAKRTTLEERTTRLNICTSCEYYDGVASQCGCPITRYQQYISKLDWKDQKCPIGKW
jgi:hypothetical protein